MVQMAQPSQPEIAPDLGEIRSSAESSPSSQTPRDGTPVGTAVSARRISGRAGWWKPPCPDLERAPVANIGPGLLDSRQAPSPGGPRSAPPAIISGVSPSGDNWPGKAGEGSVVGGDEDWEGAERGHRGGEAAAIELVHSLLSRTPVIRPRDVQAGMGSRWWLGHLVNLGELVKVGAGLFSLPGRRPCPSELALAPRAILGLTSALWAHRLLADEPVPVHLVLQRGSRVPRQRDVPLCISWARDVGEAWLVHRGPGTLAVHRIERALVDCLRYRCGLEAGRVEALTHRALTTGTVSPGQLHDAAAAVALGGDRLRFLESMLARWRRSAARGRPRRRP